MAARSEAGSSTGYRPRFGKCSRHTPCAVASGRHTECACYIVLFAIFSLFSKRNRDRYPQLIPFAIVFVVLLV